MKSKSVIFELILLELLSYVPVVLILGNILPPLGNIKLHWLYLGAIFLNTLILLLQSKKSFTLLILIFLLLPIHVLASLKFSIGEFIDFIAGPLLLIAVVNLVVTDKLKLNRLKFFRAKLLFSFSVPVLIAFFQFLGLLPLEILNAKYVNVTIFGSEIVNRVNGYLFHGIELAVIIFFLFVNLSFFTRNSSRYLLFFTMVFLEYTTLIKTGIITAILFTIYYSYFIDLRLRSLKSIMIGLAIALGFSFIFILIPDLEANRFHFNVNNFEFENELFTGRGYIWNTYLRGIRDFNWSQILMGSGFGSAPLVFERNAIFDQEWTPGPHNQLLDLFVNGGLAAIGLITGVLILQYRKLKRYFEQHVFFFSRYCYGVVLIPLLIMGLTAPIMSMFAYWCGLSLTILSLKLWLKSES